MATFYHPATESLYEHYLRHGFLSMSSLIEAERLWNSSRTLYKPKTGAAAAGCRTLACSSYENALEYGGAYYGPNIDLRIIEIEGEYDSYPIKGKLVPEGTVFLLGEIPAENVSLIDARKPVVEGVPRLS
ncbi:hypothetical protein HFN89_01060 [Rhizobium laguerreae]|nr:hypothetical protein [Rhizobium laguerreae]